MIDWDAIVARESGAVWRTLWKMLGRRGDVEDCFQETFVAAVRVAEREEVANWTALLCRIATARALDVLRKRYRDKPLGSNSDGLAEVPAASSGPVETIVAKELSTRLRSAIAELPEAQAELFSLFALQGWSQREIAISLGMTENQVGVVVHRARSRLKTILHGDSTP